MGLGTSAPTFLNFGEVIDELSKHLRQILGLYRRYNATDPLKRGSVFAKLFVELTKYHIFSKKLDFVFGTLPIYDFNISSKYILNECRKNIAEQMRRAKTGGIDVAAVHKYLDAMKNFAERFEQETEKSLDAMARELRNDMEMTKTGIRRARQLPGQLKKAMAFTASEIDVLKSTVEKHAKRSSNVVQFPQRGPRIEGLRNVAASDLSKPQMRGGRRKAA